MNDIFRFDFNALVAICFLTLFGILAEQWLVKNGFVRDKTYAVIIVVVCSILMKQLWFYTVSWSYFILLTILAIIFGVNRGDLWTTMNKGRWWWNQN